MLDVMLIVLTIIFFFMLDRYAIGLEHL